VSYYNCLDKLDGCTLNAFHYHFTFAFKKKKKRSSKLNKMSYKILFIKIHIHLDKRSQPYLLCGVLPYI
jgi:hypothetical protein